MAKSNEDETLEVKVQNISIRQSSRKKEGFIQSVFRIWKAAIHKGTAFKTHTKWLPVLYA